MNALKSFFITLFVACNVGGNACVAAPVYPEQSIMTNRSSDTASSSIASTYCMGRFLIDVPVNSRLSGGNYKYDFIAIESAKALTLEEFRRDVAKRESDLKSARNKETKQGMLLQSVEPDASTRILASWKADFSADVINVSGYRWIDGKRFMFQLDVDDDRLESGLNRMRDALARLHSRADTDIPIEPGYCFAGGFVSNSRWRNEEAGVDFRIADHPDTIVSVWFYPLSIYKHDKPLLERMGGMTQLLGNLATSVHVLRKGDRKVGPYKGQEHLASAPSSGGMRGHAFVWETQGDGTLDTPAIKIELSTGNQDLKGNPQKTSLTDEQAMKLWDDILNSFRLRPTGTPVKTSDVGPEPHVPLGELAATGRACPQTGWWQASEAGEIEGGARQYFRAGETMPQVTALGESSLWQKFKGARPSYRTATVWKLVDYDAAPAHAAEENHTQTIAKAAPDDAPSSNDKG
jgi:hypothetical protein